MEDIDIKNFKILKELDDPTQLDHTIKYFLMGENIINQKITKDVGDVVTIYVVIKYNKKENLVYYVPKYYKLIK